MCFCQFCGHIRRCCVESSSFLLNSVPLQSQHSTSSASGVHQLTVLEMAYTLRSMTKTLNQLLCTEGVIIRPQGSELVESAGPGGRGADNYIPPCYTAYSGREAGKTGSYIGIYAVCTFAKSFCVHDVLCPPLRSCRAENNTLRGAFPFHYDWVMRSSLPPE